MLDYLVLDIEASKIPHFKPWQSDAFLSSVGVGHKDNYSDWFFNPEIGDTEQHLKEIQSFLKNTELLVGHNLKYDLLWLIHCGLKLPKKIWCTQIAEYLIRGHDTSKGLSLNAVGEAYKLGSKVDEMATYWEAGYNTDEIPIKVHKKYLKQDVKLTEKIYLKQRSIIEKAGLLPVMELTCALSIVLAYCEYTGVPVDKEVVQEIYQNGKQEVELLEQKMIELVGTTFNPASSQQLSAVLFGGTIKEDGRETYTVTLKSGIQKEKSRKCVIQKEITGLGFECTQTSEKTGNPSTGHNAIKALSPNNEQQKEFLSLLLSYKNVGKMLSTLISKNDEGGWINLLDSKDRLHCTFNQAFTVTGRLSSSNPNLQNVPRGNTSPLKKCIVPKKKDWVILNLDLAQIEWRQAAELSRDPVMLQELYDGVDIHSANACALFGVSLEDKDSEDEERRNAFKKARQTSKTVSFRLLYGGSSYGFFMDSNMPNLSQKEWDEVVDNFYQKYKGLKEYQDALYKDVLNKGYISTISGRVFSFKGKDFSSSKERKEMKRSCANYPVQGSSADVLNCCIVELFNSSVYKKSRANIIMLVHDSIVIECHKDDASAIAKCTLDIFKNLPKIFEKRFGHTYVTPIFGDCEVGLNYKDVVSCDETSIEDTIKKLYEDV